MESVEPFDSVGARALRADCASSPVGDGVIRAPGKWTFGDGLPRVFHRHVRRSIPGYDELHEKCLEHSRSLPRASRLLDLGCSTGTLTQKLRHIHPCAEIVGVDREPGMIEEAYRLDPAGHYVCADLAHFDLGSWDGVFALYVLQFIPDPERRALLRKIHAALVPGGSFLLAEKVREEDPPREARARAEYHAFKRAQGFSQAEILAKEKSLSGVLLPWTAEENVRELERSGFRKVEAIFSSLCFRAWIAWV